MQVKKAVIPAAGLGTRFLPATKTVPKELLPIVDVPIILHVVREAIEAGLEDLIIIAGRNKTAIEDFFDRSYELEDLLEKTGKTELLDQVRNIQSMVNVISVRQKEAKGLGHAVAMAQPIVGKEPFAVLLGDEIMVHDEKETNTTARLVQAFQDTQTSTVAVMEVAHQDVQKYGIVQVSNDSEPLMTVEKVVEKPTPSQAPSRLALPGRYLFTHHILEDLRQQSPGKNGEIQLTDAMTKQAQSHGLLATRLTCQRFDAGDKLGFMKANIEMGLRHPEIGSDLRDYLKTLSF